MAIRPLDMQTIIPRLTEISKINQNENNKGNFNQQLFSKQMSEEVEKQHHTVNQTDKDEKADHQADAKEKGKNRYFKRADAKKDKAANKKVLPSDGKDHIIDIQI